MHSWTGATEDAVRQHVAETDDAMFTRQKLIDGELDSIVIATRLKGATLAMTLSRELQEIRNRKVLEIMDDCGR